MTIGGTKQRRYKWSDWVGGIVLILIAAIIGVVCGLITAFLIVLSIDPASGMGI